MSKWLRVYRTERSSRANLYSNFLLRSVVSAVRPFWFRQLIQLATPHLGGHFFWYTSFCPKSKLLAIMICTKYQRTGDRTGVAVEQAQGWFKTVRVDSDLKTKWLTHTHFVFKWAVVWITDELGRSGIFCSFSEKNAFQKNGPFLHIILKHSATFWKILKLLYPTDALLRVLLDEMYNYSFPSKDLQ